MSPPDGAEFVLEELPSHPIIKFSQVASMQIVKIVTGDFRLQAQTPGFHGSGQPLVPTCQIKS
jgi:hypothetical protein